MVALKTSPGEMIGLSAGYFVGGIATTVICLGAGMSGWVVVLAAAVMYSASSTLAVVGLLASGASTASGLIAGLLVSSRFGVLAVALSPRLERSRPRRALAAFWSIDPGVAVAMREPDAARTRQAWWRIAPLLYAAWMVGTVVGLPLHSSIPNPKTWGLDAVLPGTLVPILAAAFRRRDGFLTAVTAALVCALAIPRTAAGVPVLLALFGVLVGLAFRRR